MEKLSPLSQRIRIDIIDALRGFAIFGILMVNMPLMFSPLVEGVMSPSLGNDTIDILAKVLITFFFEGKFFVLFSFLFGFGFYIFLHKDGEPGKDVLKTFRRRLFWLLLFGIFHVTFLWEGDILIYYALFGFLLILFRKSSIRKISIWMMVFFLIPIIFIGFLSMLPSILASNPEALAAFEQGNQEQLLATQDLVNKAYKVYSKGSYVEIINMNWEQWGFLSIGLIMFYPTCMVMFLLGLVMGRKGILADYIANLPLFKKVLWYTLPIGIIFNLLFLFSIYKAEPSGLGFWGFIGIVASIIGGITLMFAYVSGLILLYAKGKFGKLFSGFSAVGRMALTNYLSHSLIALLLFRSIGLGFYGKPEVWQGIILTLVIFGLQIPFSKWWLSKFRFGPLEWLWRSLTYGRMQAFKL